MSVLIKGMDMPTSCWRCPLCLTIDPDTYRCLPTGQEFESTFDAIDHIVCSCPLVPVPPHGRLIDIDADALEKSLSVLLQFPSNLVNGQWIVNTIREQPTIIEAEGGEHDKL